MEELEWKFKYISHRDRLKFSNGNKNIKNNCGFSVDLRLRNKTMNNDKEYKVTKKSEIKDDDWLQIGVFDCESGEPIHYTHKFGFFEGFINFDKNQKIKTLKEKLNVEDCVRIKDTFVGKINDKKVFKVSFHKNQEELFATFYSQERRTLWLSIGSKIQLEVNVKGKILINY